MKIRVPEGIAGAIVKNSAALPLFLSLDARRVGLLIDSVIDILLGVADFDIAVVIGDARRRIGIGTTLEEGLTRS